MTLADTSVDDLSDAANKSSVADVDACSAACLADSSCNYAVYDSSNNCHFFTYASKPKSSSSGFTYLGKTCPGTLGKSGIFFF